MQAILFDKKQFTKAAAERWLKRNGKKPIKKAHLTANYRRYRLIEPVKGGKYRTITIDKGVKAVLIV